MADFGLTTVIFKPHFKHFNFRNLSRLVTWLAILVKTGILGFLDSGRKSWTLDSRRWTLDAGLWTLDSGRWTLDAGRWPLDADFKDDPDIMLSELVCFSETKRYFNYSTNQKQGWQFLYYREIPHKETKHNEPFKSVLKKSYSLGQNSPKNSNCDAFL